MNIISALLASKRSAFAWMLATLLACCALAGCASQESPESVQEAVPQESSQSEDQKRGSSEGDVDFGYTQRQLDSTYDKAAAVPIDLTGEEASVHQAKGVVVDGTLVTISAEGVYLISGMLSDGRIVVDAPQDAQVQLVLNGASIHNSDGPALLVKQAGECFVTLAEGSQNALTGGAASQEDESGEEACAALFSKADLTLNGSGSLAVASDSRSAVYSNRALVVTGGVYDFTAAERGMYGRHCVKIHAGTLDVSAQGCAVESDGEGASRGFVNFDGGKISLNAGANAVQARSLARVMGGSLAVDAVGDGLHSDGKVLIGDGRISIHADGDAVHARTILTVDGGSVDAGSCAEGYKAEKIYVNGGTTVIVSSGDALNAVSKKAAIAEESEQSGDRVGQSKAKDGEKPNAQEALEMGVAEYGEGRGDENCLVKIAGGELALTAGGDGIDSSGSIRIAGGVVLVSASGVNENSVLDYDLSASISGGTLIAVCMGDSVQSFTEATQPFALVKASGEEGSNVALVGKDDVLLSSFVTLNGFDTVLVSAPELEDGQRYSLVVGGIVENASGGSQAEAPKVSGGNATEFTASSTPAGGMGGLDSEGKLKQAGNSGDVRIPKRK